MVSGMSRIMPSHGGVGSVRPGRVVSRTTNRNRMGTTSGGVKSLLAGRDSGPSLQQQRQSANRANEERYQRLLDQVAKTRENVQSRLSGAEEALEGVGQAEQQRIQDEEAKQQAATQQSLISRGLGNTTITETARRGVSSDAERAQQRLSEQIAQMRSGQQERAAGMELNLGQFAGSGIMSRQDVGPDMGLYVKLLQQLSAA